jgi:RNA polymerase sigma-70 factor (ECF subfamily)
MSLHSPEPTRELSESERRDLERIERWNRGDRSALHELLVASHGWLQREIRRRMTPALRARAETLDFVQDSVLDFLEDSPRFLIDNVHSFRNLLKRIAHNRISEHYRRWSALRRQISRERPLPEETHCELASHGADPAEKAATSEEQDHVRLALEFLQPEHRELMILRYHQSWDWPEIGAEMGLSPDAARMQHNRCRKRLERIVRQLRRGELSEALDEIEERW